MIAKTRIFRKGKTCGTISAMKTTLGFFGAGKMAEGILAAASLAKGFDPQSVLMAEKLPARAKELAKKYKVRTTADVKEVAACAKTIFLAVRPQDVTALAAEVKPLLTAKTLVVSIAAGKSLATLRKMLGRDVRLVRVMPNLALRAKEGMCAICPAANATAADVKLVAKILNGAGRTVVLQEKHFDAVTALSGSGPAFFAYMEEAMALGGEALGLPADAARLLAEQEAREKADAEAARQTGKKPSGTEAKTEREAVPEVPKKKSATEIWQASQKALGLPLTWPENLGKGEPYHDGEWRQKG